MRDQAAAQQADEVARKFEAVATVLVTLDVGAVWKAATQDERRFPPAGPPALDV